MALRLFTPLPLSAKQQQHPPPPPPPSRVSFQVRESTGNPKPLPLLVKIAPDLTDKEKKEIAGVVLATKVSKARDFA